jgi:MoxR-like ATPase
VLDYPDPASERQMLAMLRGESRQDAEPAGAPLSQEDLFACRAEVDRVHVSEALDQYLVDLVNATRHPGGHDADLARWIQVGASPRGAIALDKVARAHAWLAGQDYVSPDDVRSVARPVLRHRLHLSYDAVADGVSADQVIDKLLDTVAVPV